MIDPQRLRDEIELRDAIDRHKARERENTIWAIGLFILVAHALIHWWIFVRPERIAHLTPPQLRRRRQCWFIVTVAVLIALYIYGSID
jgi:hypothetical protein